MECMVWSAMQFYFHYLTTSIKGIDMWWNWNATAIRMFWTTSFPDIYSNKFCGFGNPSRDDDNKDYYLENSEVSTKNIEL